MVRTSAHSPVAATLLQCFGVASCFRPAPMEVVSVVCRLSAQGLNARVFLLQLWVPWGPVLDPTFSS